MPTSFASDPHHCPHCDALLARDGATECFDCYLRLAFGWYPPAPDDATQIMPAANRRFERGVCHICGAPAVNAETHLCHEHDQLAYLSGLILAGAISDWPKARHGLMMTTAVGVVVYAFAPTSWRIELDDLLRPFYRECRRSHDDDTGQQSAA